MAACKLWFPLWKVWLTGLCIGVGYRARFRDLRKWLLHNDLSPFVAAGVRQYVKRNRSATGKGGSESFAEHKPAGCR